MGNYFLTGLSPEQRSKLPSELLSGSYFDLAGQSGILLDQPQLQQLLSALNASVANATDTAYVGIKQISLNFDLPQSEPYCDPNRKLWRQKYIQACEARLAGLERTVMTELLVSRQEVELTQQQLAESVLLSALNERKTREQKVFNREDLGKEFDKLVALPRVLSVEVEPAEGRVSVHTDTLYCLDPESNLRHQIGQFQIDIYPGGQADLLRWFNKTRRVNAVCSQQQAPNVLLSGRACFANARNVFPELIAKFQFAIVVQLAMDFIEQISVDNPAAKQIKKWPLA